MSSFSYNISEKNEQISTDQHEHIDEVITILNDMTESKDSKPIFKPDTLIIRVDYKVFVCIHDTDDKVEFTTSMDKLLDFVECYRNYEFYFMGDWNNTGEQLSPYSFQFRQKGKYDNILYTRIMNRQLKLSFPTCFTSAKGRLFSSQFNKVLKIDQNCIDGILYFPNADITTEIESIETNAFILYKPFDNKLIPSNWCADHTTIVTEINNYKFISLNLCGESGTGGFNWAEFMTPQFSDSIISNPELKKKIKDIISQYTTEEKIKDKWYSKRTRHLQEMNIHRPPELRTDWETYSFYNELLTSLENAKQVDSKYPESKLKFPLEEVIEARDTVLQIYNAIYEDELIKPLLVEWFDYILKNPKMSWKNTILLYLQSNEYNYLFFQEVNGQMANELLKLKDEILDMGYKLFMKDTETKTRGVIFVKI
jgi:hypothetical protein